MGMREKLKAAAMQAAVEAMTTERGRCLWCVDQVIAELKGKLEKKLLSEAQLHIARTKFKIAEAVGIELRRAIVSGARPQGGPGGTTGTAGISPPKEPPPFMASTIKKV